MLLFVSIKIFRYLNVVQFRVHWYRTYMYVTPCSKNFKCIMPILLTKKNYLHKKCVIVVVFLKGKMCS